MSRETILAALRANRPVLDEPLSLSDIAIQYDDPVATFATMLSAAGGRCLEVESAEQARAVLREAGGDDAQLLQGHIGVAENAAVWVPFSPDQSRAAPFLAETMGILLPRSAIVSDMQSAYRRIEGQGALPDYGVFIAGPSKTADIAQCLVIGAHGPIRMIVFLT